MGSELSYLAGLFDGEGHIGASVIPGTNRKQVRVNCQITMRTHAGGDVVQLFHDRWGGYLRHGVPRGSSKTPCSIWQVTNRAAIRFLTDIVPYLRVKKPQALAAIAFDASRIMPKAKGIVDGKRGGRWPLCEEGIAQREEFVSSIRALNR